MRLVTKDDFIDFYLKVKQRGSKFILSKLNPSGLARTKSAFDNSSEQNSNWWIIPTVKSRWNEKITGNPTLEYEEYTVNKYLKGRKQLKMLSIGSGVCSHELKFAQYPIFKEVNCLDIAENLLEKAAIQANNLGLKNMNFWSEDIYKLDLADETYDVILFHSSLHHFSNIEGLLSQKIKKWLKSDGLLIINEYVGNDRLQFSENQIKLINQGLDLIPNRLKRRFKSKLTKNKFHGSGYLRMIIADPSECIESSQILPTLRKHFQTIEEKTFGGNLLMNILKDISHNFIDINDKEAQRTLKLLFDLEDQYLETNQSDFIFGIYRKEENN